MDFHTLPRRQLQALCKLNKIPANKTNVAMADALKSLEIVKGIEDYVKPAESVTGQSSIESPERDVVTSPKVTRTGRGTSSRRKAEGDESEGLQIPVKSSRKRTEKAINEIPKTPAVRSRSNRVPSASVSRMVNQLSETEGNENQILTRRSKLRKEEEVGTVERVYSTRRSARLTEKKLLESRKKESSEVIKFDSSSEAISINDSDDVLENVSFPGSDSQSVVQEDLKRPQDSVQLFVKETNFIASEAIREVKDDTSQVETVDNQEVRATPSEALGGCNDAIVEELNNSMSVDSVESQSVEYGKGQEPLLDSKNDSGENSHKASYRGNDSRTVLQEDLKKPKDLVHLLVNDSNFVALETVKEMKDDTLQVKREHINKDESIVMPVQFYGALDRCNDVIIEELNNSMSVEGHSVECNKGQETSLGSENDVGEIPEEISFPGNDIQTEVQEDLKRTKDSVHLLVNESDFVALESVKEIKVDTSPVQTGDDHRVESRETLVQFSESLDGCNDVIIEQLNKSVSVESQLVEYNMGQETFLDSENISVKKLDMGSETVERIKGAVQEANSEVLVALGVLNVVPGKQNMNILMVENDGFAASNCVDDKDVAPESIGDMKDEVLPQDCSNAMMFESAVHVDKGLCEVDEDSIKKSEKAVLELPGPVLEKKGSQQNVGCEVISSYPDINPEKYEKTEENATDNNSLDHSTSDSEKLASQDEYSEDIAADPEIKLEYESSSGNNSDDDARVDSDIVQHTNPSKQLNSKRGPTVTVYVDKADVALESTGDMKDDVLPEDLNTSTFENVGHVDEELSEVDKEDSINENIEKAVLELLGQVLEMKGSQDIVGCEVIASYPDINSEKYEKTEENATGNNSLDDSTSDSEKLASQDECSDIAADPEYESSSGNNSDDDAFSISENIEMELPDQVLEMKGSQEIVGCEGITSYPDTDSEKYEKTEDNITDNNSGDDTSAGSVRLSSQDECGEDIAVNPEIKLDYENTSVEDTRVDSDFVGDMTSSKQLDSEREPKVTFSEVLNCNDPKEIADQSEMIGSIDSSSNLSGRVASTSEVNSETTCPRESGLLLATDMFCGHEKLSIKPNSLICQSSSSPSHLAQETELALNFAEDPLGNKFPSSLVGLLYSGHFSPTHMIPVKNPSTKTPICKRMSHVLDDKDNIELCGRKLLEVTTEEAKKYVKESYKAVLHELNEKLLVTTMKSPSTNTPIHISDDKENNNVKLSTEQAKKRTKEAFKAVLHEMEVKKQIPNNIVGGKEGEKHSAKATKTRPPLQILPDNY